MTQHTIVKGNTSGLTQQDLEKFCSSCLCFCVFLCMFVCRQIALCWCLSWQRRRRTMDSCQGWIQWYSDWDSHNGKKPTAKVFSTIASLLYIFVHDNTFCTKIFITQLIFIFIVLGSSVKPQTRSGQHGVFEGQGQKKNVKRHQLYAAGHQHVKRAT